MLLIILKFTAEKPPISVVMPVFTRGRTFSVSFFTGLIEAIRGIVMCLSN
jgi:hypothetical protein